MYQRRYYEESIKASLKRVADDKPKDDAMTQVRLRSKELQELGLSFNDRVMSYTHKDFNVHSTEIKYSSDEQWENIIEGIKAEMERRDALKPFKDVDRDTCNHYWGILTSKCSEATTDEFGRDEFVTYLLDIDTHERILEDVGEHWDVIMKEYVTKFYTPSVTLGNNVFMSDWKHYNG